MNARVSRLLRAFSARSGRPLRACKRAWDETPRKLRGALRLELEAYLNAVD